MYRRYNSSPPRGRPQNGSAARQHTAPAPPQENKQYATEPRYNGSPPQNPEPRRDKSEESGLLGSLINMVPPEIYNRKTKKLLGLFTAEDLLLVSLILMTAESDNPDDTALLIALLYILAA